MGEEELGKKEPIEGKEGQYGKETMYMLRSDDGLEENGNFRQKKEDFKIRDGQCREKERLCKEENDGKEVGHGQVRGGDGVAGGLDKAPPSPPPLC